MGIIDWLPGKRSNELNQEELIEVISNFIMSDSLEESLKILEDHPELLQKEVDSLLEGLILNANQQNDENSKQMFEACRTFLQRCREVGVDRAYEEIRFLKSDESLGDLPSILNELDGLSQASTPEDILRRIQLCQQAISLIPREQDPELWAKLHVELGISICMNTTDGSDSDLEQVVDHYQQALEVYTRQDFPEQWAAIHNNLANAYKKRMKGDRAYNFEQAISCHMQALKVYTYQDYPKPWAIIHNNLANAFIERVNGDQADNLEQAIKHCHQALRVLTCQDFPEQWAMIQNNMGFAFWIRTRGDRADNLERVIEYYRNALKVYTCRDFPEKWAEIKHSIANTYSIRIKGDRADNIEQAIGYYQQALKVYTRRDFPIKWAEIQNELADNLNFRVIGDRDNNFNQAIDHYQKALEVFTRKDFPLDWAATQNNLAASYGNSISGNRANNIEQAINCSQQALEIFTRQGYPKQWAAIQNNLANAYEERMKGDRADNIDNAIDRFNQALEVYTYLDYPSHWASIQNNLANAYCIRIKGDRADNIQRAITHYQQALEVYNSESYPFGCRRTASSLGGLHFQEHRWNDASDLLLLGKIAAEKLYQASLFLSSKDAELSETGDLYHNASYSLAKVDQTLKAAVCLEQGRARVLSEAMARDRAYLGRVKKDDPEAYRRYKNVTNLIRNIEASERSDNIKWNAKYESLRKDVSIAYAEMQEVIERIQRISGYEAFLKEPDEDDIAAAMIDDLPLVYLLTTTEGSLALIAARELGKKKGGKVQELTIAPVWLDKFNEDSLRRLLYSPAEDEGSGGWFGAYDRWLKAQELQDQDAYENAEGLWFDAIIKVTEELWDSVIGPVVDSLCSHGFTQAILIPSGYLGLLPLHAASWIENGTRHYAMEKISFAYAPSARTLIQAMNIAKSYKGETLLAIDEPESIASALPSSQEEVNSIAAFFNNSKVLRHEKAEREKVLRILPSFQVAHFSCHGAVNRGDPDQSGLYMANDQMLTVQDLFQLNLKGARMATLSACETGVIGTKLPDEVIALPSAFMRAGFAGVVSSLWTVEDESAAILMKEFYKQWQNKELVPIRALNEAQKLLRKDERFKHPFYWAAFYLTGV